MKTKFSSRRQKSSQPNTDCNRSQPMPMSEDIFLRNDLTQKPSITSSEDDSSPPSINYSCHSADLTYDENQRIQTQGRNRSILMRAFIPDGLEPGQKVKVQYPDGSKMKTEIPPRTKWVFINHHGEPRPSFMVVPVPAEPCSVFTAPPPCIATSHKEEKRESEPKLRNKVHFAEQSTSVCQCTPSLGVYDSICPYHGTGLRRS